MKMGANKLKPVKKVKWVKNCEKGETAESG